MQAITFHAPRELRYESVPDPALREPRDVVVRVELAAVCGSDLHPYHGRETGLDVGTVMGHEFLGTVVDAGAEVERFRPGARVVAPFTTSCGRCFYCRIGLTCRCVESQLFGWVQGGRGLHGAQAELVRVPLADSTLVALPEGIDEEQALLAGDVLSTGYGCAESAGVGPGSVVAVVGCGPVGLMAVVGARELGAAAVIAVDLVPERRALAIELGALAFEPEGALAALRERTEGRGADAVLEAVGSPQATRLALELVRPGGTIAAAGVHTESAFAFTPGEAYDKNLSYRAGRCPARHYAERMLALVRSRKYPLGRVLSHRLPLSEGARAYEMFDRKLDGCTKVLLLPGA